MTNKDQVKSLLVTLGSLALKVRDQLAESYDQDTYTSLLEELKQIINVFEQTSADLTEELTQVEQGEIYASLSNVRSWQIKLLERINFIKSFSTNASTVTKKKHGRLPEVKLTTFKGNFDEWETFWSSFRINVDVRDDLERSTKFIYLAQSLEGEPKEMIFGLAITDDNYTIAVHILRDRYDNATKQTNVLLQKFHSLPTPKHNPKDLQNFLTEYRKVKTQLAHVLDFQQSELVVKSTLVRKLAFQTFDKICDLYVTYDFTLKQMETGIQHIIDKLEQVTLALGEKANVKQVGVSSQQTKQSNQKTNQRCSYCSCDHYFHECTKYKTVNARKDRVMSLKLCFNCLTPGHSSKTCRSTRTCRTRRLHRHSSLCIKAHSNSNSSEASNPSPSNSNSAVSQGKSNQSSTSTSSTSNRNFKAQAQTHPNKPVVTPNKTNTSQACSSTKTSSQSPAVDTTYVTSVSSTSFPNNVLPTATLNVNYCDQQVNVRAFFDTGSHRSFFQSRGS